MCSKQNRQFRADDGQTAPYCLLLRPESPCRLGQLDLAIETASNRITKLNRTELQNDGVGNAVNESIMLHSVVAFHGNQQLEPVRAYRYNLTLNLPQTGLLLHRRSPHLPRFKRVNNLGASRSRPACSSHLLSLVGAESLSPTSNCEGTKLGNEATRILSGRSVRNCMMVCWWKSLQQLPAIRTLQQLSYHQRSSKLSHAVQGRVQMRWKLERRSWCPR
jgi:hypothetical protein